MCKKIAQLTKVICALNTKNDEQEESIQALKESHQEEVQRILAETKEAALRYESKVEEAQMLQRHIQDLEAALEKHRKPKEEVSAKFPTGRQESESFLFQKARPDVEPEVGKRLLACDKDPAGFTSRPLAFERNPWEDPGKLSGIPCEDLQEVVGEMVTLRWESPPPANHRTRESSQLQSSQEKHKACAEGHQRKNHGTEEVASSHQAGQLPAHREAKGREIRELKKSSQKPKEKTQDPFVQQGEISKQPKEKGKSRDHTPALDTRNGENQRIKVVSSRLDSGRIPPKDIKLSSASLPKEAAQTLREEWYYQKAELEAQVRQLKQRMEQQEKSFRGAFRQPDVLHSNEGKEKALQGVLKQSQLPESQLEASRQEAVALLEKEFQEVKKAWKKEYDDKFKGQQQSHFQELQALEEKASKVLQSELDRMQKQQTLLTDSLRKQLSDQQVSSMNQSEVKEKLQEQLKSLMGVQKQQEESHQEQIQLLKDELGKCQKEISELKKESSLWKDAVDRLSGDVELRKQTVPGLQGRESQEKRLEEGEEKARKAAPGLGDRHLLSCLQQKLNEKEEGSKELRVGRIFQPPPLSNREMPCSRSFSFSASPVACLAPLAKKKMDEAAPSCIVTVPKFASYAKSFLSGELRPKRTQAQNIKSMVLDPNLGCVHVCCPSVLVLENRPLSSLQNNETSKPRDAQKPDSQHQEWFTKYFSF